MCAQVTDDDVGKDVVNANGEKVGIVAEIEHGTARVEPDPGITDSIKATLGWGDSGEEAYPLQEEAIDRVTDEEIRLRGDLGDRAGDAMGSETDSGVGTGAGTDRSMDDTDDGIAGTGIGSDSEDRNRDDDSSLGR